MTKIEKQMIGVMVVLVLLLFISVATLRKGIEDAGGVSGIAVSVGKEIKDIKKQISEE